MLRQNSGSPLNSATFPGGDGEKIAWILDHSSDGFAMLDQHGLITYLNRTGENLLAASPGLDQSPWLGRNLWEFFLSSERVQAQKIYIQAVENGSAQEFELLSRSGKRWFSFRVIPLGASAAIYFRETSEQKKTAAALQQSEAHYQLLVTSMEEGFCLVEVIWDQAGNAIDYRFLEANPAFELHTGIVDCQGKTIRELHPLHENYWQELYGRVARTGKSVRFDWEASAMGRWFSGYAFRVRAAGDQSTVGIVFSDVTQQRVAEEAAKRLERENRSRLAELETLLSVLPVGIGIASDPECREIRTNPALARMLGISEKTNASKTASAEENHHGFQILDPTGREIPGEQLPMQVASREGRTVQDVEIIVKRENGTTLQLLGYAAPLFNDAGLTRGSVGTFVDITERRRALERRLFLTRMDETMRSLSEASEIVATAAQLLGEHLHVDRCAYAVVEEDQDTMQILGDYCRPGIPSMVGRLTFTQFGQEVLHLMRANETYVVNDVETYIPPPQDLDAYRNTQIRAVICVPLHKSGRFAGAMAVHQNTKRQWTEDEVALIRLVADRCWESLERANVTRELQESDERFRLLGDNMAQMAWMAAVDGSIYWFNRRWFECTGTTMDGVLGWGWQKVIHPEHVQRVLEKWQHHVQHEELWEDTFPMRSTDGQFRWYLSRALPFRSSQDHEKRWFGTHTDITEQMLATENLAHAKEAAERANQSKDEFLAVLSHELRTPLTPVLLSVANLEVDPTLTDTIREDLAVIRRNIELEARLIDDLLDVTRISRGLMSLRLEHCDVHSLIQLAVDILVDDVQEKGIHLSVSCEATSFRLTGDPARLQQVLWNLLKNAVKFTPSGGVITLRTYNEEHELIIEVQDSGIGINADAIAKIFKPFEQGGLANNHRFGGLGLGLSISKAIVLMHGGRIAAFSPGLGHGSTFRVTLPTEKFQAPTVSPPPRDAPASSPAATLKVPKARILLVEDHAPTLKILSHLLRQSGLVVTSAANIQQAQQQASNGAFDLVISDVGLPDGSGYDLMTQLKNRYGLRGIALTGYGTEDDHQRSLRAGFVQHLTKPVNFSQLKRAIRESLGQPLT